MWWSKELKDIKCEMLSIKMKFKPFRIKNNTEGEDAIRLKELRKLFRKQQRINIRNKDLEKYKFIQSTLSILNTLGLLKTVQCYRAFDS